MRKICLSTAALFLGAAVGSFLASYLLRHGHLTSAPVPAYSAGEEESNTTEPIVLLPKAPPQYFFDTIEPIVVQPESEEYYVPPSEARFSAPTYPALTLLPSRMPLADEPSEEEPALSETSLWSGLVEWVQSLLPVPADAEPASIESPDQSTPDIAEPTSLPVDAPLQMPIIDPHQHHCPGHGGCTRGYFPQPAHHFQHMTPVRVHGSVGP